MKRKSSVVLLFIFLILLIFPVISFAEEFDLPSHVLEISKENTEQNRGGEDYESVEPSEQTVEFLENAPVEINNAELVKLLNETTINPSPVGFGYRGMVYLGRWPLAYESDKTQVNWEYQVVNKNEINNLGSTEAQTLSYSQHERKELKGTLLNKVAQPDVVRRMVLEKTEAKTNLPLTYTAVIGKNTKQGQTYQVPAKKHGILEVYAPAVNESGNIVYGEVYIELKGTKKQLVVKNVTKQEISVWLPIQNHLAFSFQLK